MAHTAQYRRDIDGLRALAILPVLAFHAGLPGFSGGFVGVDVFFVISGFLITGIIAREIDEGRFSLLRFYERRARRILPALLLMIAVVLGAAALFYLPADFAGVPRSALMTLLFMANAWFFTQTGYFGGPADSMPLLHCWSLAVEEQFYLAFPFLLWACARFAPHYRARALVLAALLSFAIAFAKQADTDGFAFYLLPARAWELLAGSLIAFYPHGRTAGQRKSEALALLGLLLITGAVFLYDRSTVFPGVSALAPVVGAALLIRHAPGTMMGRLLSTRLLVGTGLISYSLYLWHWPIIVFADYLTDAPQGPVFKAALIAASFLAAWASWRIVERPFRDPRRFGQRRIFQLALGGMGAIAAIALTLVPLGGWPSRFPVEVSRLAQAAHDISPKRGRCILDETGGDHPDCILGAPVAPTAVIWGDSHGVELAWALGESLASENRSVVQRTRASCPPVNGYQVANDPGCAAGNARTMAYLMASPRISHVYLAAFWASPAYRQPGMAERIESTIAQLQGAGKSVTLIGPVPPQPFDVPRHLAQAAASGRLHLARGASLSDYHHETAWLTRHYPRLQQQGVRILDPLRVLAQGDHSRLMVNGRPAYFDSHHLSLAGARAVVTAARPAPGAQLGLALPASPQIGDDKASAPH
ncbi:MAG: acyltransferase family protein [Novosphingobium sp.]